MAVFTPALIASQPPLIYYIDTDHLGTPRVVFDPNNNQKWTWIAEPFGTTAANTSPMGATPFAFNLRMPGQVYDAESGLFYNWFRYYDPSNGRFVQFDPLGLAGGSLSPYVYVNGNPTKWIDFDGLANSGVGRQVPGTNYSVRVDPPHVPGQQQHAHIYDKYGNPIGAVSKDGTGSHGFCPEELPKNRKLIDFLKGKGFLLGAFGDGLLIWDLMDQMGVFADPAVQYQLQL